MDIFQASHTHQVSCSAHFSPNPFLPQVAHLWTVPPTPVTSQEPRRYPCLLPPSQRVGPSATPPPPDSPAPSPPHYPITDLVFLSDHHRTLLPGTQIQAAWLQNGCAQGSWEPGRGGGGRGVRKACGREWRRGTGADAGQKVLTLEHSRGSQSPLTKTGKAQRPGDETKGDSQLVPG